MMTSSLQVPDDHGWWKNLVQKNRFFLSLLPPAALSDESAFRDYVTSGVHGNARLIPRVSELPSDALEDLWTFINRYSRFAADMIRFDAFNEAFRHDREQRQNIVL